jgi:hypothetical protein
VLGESSIIDTATAMIALAGFIALWRFKIPEPLLIGAAARSAALQALNEREWKVTKGARP